VAPPPPQPGSSNRHNNRAIGVKIFFIGRSF
jgi:hypothetical protein